MTVQNTKRKVWIGIFITLVGMILIIATVSIIYYIKFTSDNIAILTVNDEPISKAEFLNVMDGEKARIYSYYAQKYNASDSIDFWEKSFSGQIPINTLKEETLKKVIRRKTEQILFKKNMLIDDISFASYIDRLKVENKRRLNAVNKGEPIYGPVQYEEAVYLDLLHGNYIEEIKNKNIIEELSVDDNEIEEYYEKNKKLIFEGLEDKPIEDVRQQIKSMIIDDKYDKLINNMIYNSNVSINERVLNDLF